MRCSKKMVVLLLAVTIVLGVTGCSKKLTQKSFVSALKSCDIEENDKIDILITGLDGHGITKSYYVAEDEDEAEELSNLILNRFNTMPDIKANSFILAVYTDQNDDGYTCSFMCHMTFENDKKAKKAYENLIEAHGDEDEGETGTKSKVTYCVDSGVSADGKNNIGTGIYLQGNTVIFLRTIVPSDTDYEFADKICGKLGLISPSEV